VTLCIIVDVNLAWIAGPLRRRGFIVYAPGDDYPMDASDDELLEWALRTGCVVVSMDAFFRGKPCSVYVPPHWDRRYNSWDIVTRIVKLAALAGRQCRWQSPGAIAEEGFSP